MQTQITIWSGDDTIKLNEQVTLTQFIRQAEAYFNQYGHLPAVGSIIKQDENSANSSVVVYVADHEYSGVQGDHFVISIDVTANQPKRG